MSSLEDSNIEKAPDRTLDVQIAARIINVMKRALAADPEAVRALIETRVPCNDALANDPTIQVVDDAGVTKVGLLGILNGIAGCVYPDGPGFVAAVLETDGRLTDFTWSPWTEKAEQDDPAPSSSPS